METSVWTRGRAFPLSRLEIRLRCPMCGPRDVSLIFMVPGEAILEHIPPGSNRRDSQGFVNERVWRHRFFFYEVGDAEAIF
jgi:hypothetical protein